MRMNYYHAMAEVIQRYWRGHFVRQHMHYYYARKKYLKGLIVKNEIIRKDVDIFIEEKNSDLRYLNRENYEERLQDYARQSHHLISTSKIPGIYNSPFRDFPAEMEFRLKAVRHRDYLAEKPKKLAQKLKIRKNLFLPLKPQPPEKSMHSSGDKIQGPFKSVAEVRKQRYKPYNPSLRCETPFYAVEEARKQLKSDNLASEISSQRFDLYRRYQPTYVGLDHTKSLYDIRNKFNLREEDPKKNISKTRMRNILSPIPLFDQLGETYTKGAFLL